MAKGKKDYLALSYLFSVILVLIPIPAWLCAVITSLSDVQIVAGTFRLFTGFWPVRVFRFVMSIP